MLGYVAIFGRLGWKILKRMKSVSSGIAYHNVGCKISWRGRNRNGTNHKDPQRGHAGELDREGIAHCELFPQNRTIGPCILELDCSKTAIDEENSRMVSCYQQTTLDLINIFGKRAEIFFYFILRIITSCHFA